MKLNFNQMKCIEEVATSAIDTLTNLPLNKRASRLRGIALIFSLIGKNGPARYAHDTANLLQELHRAETQLHINIHGDCQ